MTLNWWKVKKHWSWVEKRRVGIFVFRRHRTLNNNDLLYLITYWFIDLLTITSIWHYNIIKYYTSLNFCCKNAPVKIRKTYVKLSAVAHTFLKKYVRGLTLGNQRFPVRVWLLAICRGELSAVIAPLMFKCVWSGGSGSEELKKYSSHSPAIL